MKQIATAVGALVIASALFFGISFWMSYVVVDLVRLFDIPYLNTFSFFNVFGTIIIISIMRMKVENKKSEGDTDDQLVRSISNTLSGFVSILLMWALCYIVKYLLM